MVGEDYPHGLDERVVRRPKTAMEGGRMMRLLVRCGVCGLESFEDWPDGKHGNNPPGVWICQKHEADWIPRWVK